MVRVTMPGIMQNGIQYIEFAGLSTDDKPLGNFATGSLFLEVDTGDVYAYDEENDEWDQITALGGEG